MLYLKNTTDAQTILIPRNGEIVPGDMGLVLENTIDKDRITLSVTDLNISGHYFNLAVVLPDDIVDGEYQYNLMDGNIVVSCGLLIVGELQSPNEYEKTITYKQYESE